jgi:hypothetical protein
MSIARDTSKEMLASEISLLRFAKRSMHERDAE